MDEVPPGDWQQELQALALSVPGVKDIDKYRLRKTGFEYFIDLHIGVAGELTVSEGHAIGHAVKEAILKAKPSVYDVLMHIEPV